MRSGLVISGSAHGLIMILTIAHGIFIFSEPLNLSAKPLDIHIISEAEFDAETSVPPVVNIDHNVQEQKVSELSTTTIEEAESLSNMDEVKQHDLTKMFESDVVDPKPPTTVEIKETIIEGKEKKLDLTQNMLDPKIAELEEKNLLSLNDKGNEIRSLEKPSLEKPIARNEDRIDKIASDNKDTQSISDTDASQITDSATDPKIIEKTTEVKIENKAASTEITPDGIKDAPIVLSGAVETAVVPPSRETNQVDEEKKIDKKTSEQSHINSLVASLSEDLAGDATSSSMVVSTMEKLKLRKSINQLIGRYWNKGILIGGSDFENYIIEVEILLDSKGNIIGDVRPVKPVKPSGRYAIAFREASNAIRAAGRIPIPSEKYRNGLRLKLTFDPASGIGFE